MTENRLASARPNRDLSDMQLSTRERRIIALLGPTNTGKTHFAMERMMAHESGIIGFPLRLLARENYDRAVNLKGRGQVALMTGEEKIVPPGARYFLCTAESMPLSKQVAFVALDEVQMCADPDRGHIFTERLLGVRGRFETMFLGAETMRGVIRALIPEVEFMTRPRMSSLSYVGPKKTANLPRRSALVAFTAGDVYALAELVRRQRGGAALVMGGLSPRTRNAQVGMYQEGEVDYLVATDAIGMGLNMDIDHVAFGATRKFDGRLYRSLSASELAQIAGRAGRYMNDGTFGTTTEVDGLDEEMVRRIEEHEFEPLRQLYWRNARLDTRSLDTLRRSLAKAPERPGLVRARQADDEMALASLLKISDVPGLAADPDGVRLLWEVCRIPDFRKVMSDAHAHMLASIFRHLRTGDMRLPTDWLAEQVSRIDRVDGDIEALTQRIAHVRTWTYVSFRDDWLADAEHWREQTRRIEDKLSDALHERLTQRFVDKRTAVLVKGLKEQRQLLAAVKSDGEVVVEGHPIGHLEGFKFVADSIDATASALEAAAATRTLYRAAAQALAQEIETRTASLCKAVDDDFAFATADGAGPAVLWRGDPVGRIVAGETQLRPDICVNRSDLLAVAQRDRIQARLRAWLKRHLETNLAPLFADVSAEKDAAARGVHFRLSEHLGSMPRAVAADEIDKLTRAGRQALRRAGISIGRESIYAPDLLKPAAMALRALLYGLAGGAGASTTLPTAGRVSVPLTPGGPTAFMEAIGYRPLGALAVRVDIVERVASKAWELSGRNGFEAPAELMNLIGCNADDLAEVLRRLGYRREQKGEAVVFKKQRLTAGRTGVPRRRRERPADPDSPFAKLGELVSRP